MNTHDIKLVKRLVTLLEKRAKERLYIKMSNYYKSIKK